MDPSTQPPPPVANLELKARLLQKAGKTAEALPFLDKAVELATAAKTDPAKICVGR